MQKIQSMVSMDEIRVRLASNLRRLRAERGISQERLALEAGVDRTMLSKIERRISNPSIETLLKLANRLHVDLVALVAARADLYHQERVAAQHDGDSPEGGVRVIHEPLPRRLDP